MKKILIIGNSDGIGLQVTRELLDSKNKVVGISRSKSSIKHDNYVHVVKDVCDVDYEETLKTLHDSYNGFHVCIYAVGIGEFLDPERLHKETKVFEVNAMAAIKTTNLIVDKMIKKGQGHFIGLSSLADVIISPESPSYSASKSAVSSYWEGLGLALRNHEINISNVRFGFVDTKMAKAPVKPCMISVVKAAKHIIDCIKRPQIRVTRPRRVIPLVWLAGIPARVKMCLF